jgi:3-oxoadipate enol-lactonase
LHNDGDMPYADVNGIRMRYELCGSGSTIVLLTGFGGDADSWKSTVSVLSKKHGVVTLDNRGSGTTEYHGRFTIGDMADDTIALLDRLSVPSAHIIGWSMGTHITINMAARYPSRITSLTLISSYRYRPARTRYVLTSLTEAAENKTASVDAIGAVMNGLCLTEDFFHRREEDGMDIRLPRLPSPEQMHDQLIAIDGYDASTDAGIITAPTLSIHGLSDIMVRPEEGDALALLIRRCRSIRIEGAGHLITPGLYIEEVEQHIDAHDPLLSRLASSTF